MKKYYFMFLIVFISGLLSCEKEEGEGGNSTITGKVYVYNYNVELSNLRWEDYAPDVDVFIIYGSDTVYSDNFKTNYDGSYRFRYLHQGTYTVFAYSKDLNNKNTNRTDLLIPVKITVEISSDNQIVYVDDLVIIK
ncbi:hypothetical protein ACFLSI_03320 [Bacteroidota bacterium]